MEWKIDLCRCSGRGRCGEEPAAQIGVEPAVPLSRVESRWQQDRGDKTSGVRAFRREGRTMAIEQATGVETGRGRSKDRHQERRQGVPA